LPFSPTNLVLDIYSQFIEMTVLILAQSINSSQKYRQQKFFAIISIFDLEKKYYCIISVQISAKQITK